MPVGVCYNETLAARKLAELSNNILALIQNLVINNRDCLPNCQEENKLSVINSMGIIGWLQQRRAVKSPARFHNKKQKDVWRGRNWAGLASWAWDALLPDYPPMCAKTANTRFFFSWNFWWLTCCESPVKVAIFVWDQQREQLGHHPKLGVINVVKWGVKHMISTSKMFNFHKLILFVKVNSQINNICES